VTARYADQFWTKVQPVDSGCWEWQGAKTDGYGNIRLGGRAGRNVRAHRLAYELACGLIPEGMIVCHHCDNPPCCNPDHLFLGSHAANVADKITKGRGIHGEKNGIARLTVSAVKMIRRRCDAGETQRSLARELGVSETTISRVVHRHLWGHVA
jgi:hypothetical protein